MLSVTVLERALGTAFVSQHFQFPVLHLIEERQHQASIQCSNQHVFRTPHVRSALEYRGVADFDVRVLRSE